MQSKGILQAAEFTLQTSEINQKISALRAKRKQIMEQKDEELYELQELNELIENCKPSNRFDAELFERIVDEFPKELFEKAVAEVGFDLDGTLWVRLINGMKIGEEEQQCLRMNQPVL